LRNYLGSGEKQIAGGISRHLDSLLAAGPEAEGLLDKVKGLAGGLMGNT
jgi:hypothetical protein